LQTVATSGIIAKLKARSRGGIRLHCEMPVHFCGTNSLIASGRYSVWFKTAIGEGAGVVEFSSDGKLTGGDTTFSYSGNWAQEAERFKAALSAKRTRPGPPGVFGMDEIDIIVSGNSDGSAGLSCTGFAKQSPGLTLEVVLIRTADD
jgi:T3SS negative regulator,GrlR